MINHTIQGTVTKGRDLFVHGFEYPGHQQWNLSTEILYEHIIRNNEGVIAHGGAIVVNTGIHTGRSPNDKFIVDEASTRDRIWWGNVNRPCDGGRFDHLHHRLMAYLRHREIFIQDCFAGADRRYRLPVRVITTAAWHSLFARTMFILPTPQEGHAFIPEFTILAAPGFEASPEIDGTNSGTFIVINFARRLVLIGGTAYAGEIKKAVFTLLNDLLPLQGVLPMHCAANYGNNPDDLALFFGLSGTGKTTLSADPTRTLIGDDEHGWSDDGVFNFEGGCYAKVMRLSRDGEPEIYATTRRFGTLLENVVVTAANRQLDLDDASFTENTRAAYPICAIPNADVRGTGGHPRHIIFLTADAFGVLPPIARLTPDQAMYHFITGYTAKVAGTERGMGGEPQPTFSACFGGPFLPQHPIVYANLLREKLKKHGTTVWLVNTGWTGGPYGVGRRITLGYTRAMVEALLKGALENAETVEDPIFGLHIPTHIPDIPNQLLYPRNTWRDPAHHDTKAAELAHRFAQNFEKYAEKVDSTIRQFGPKVL